MEHELIDIGDVKKVIFDNMRSERDDALEKYANAREEIGSLKEQIKYYSSRLNNAENGLSCGNFDIQRLKDDLKAAQNRISFLVKAMSQSPAKEALQEIIDLDKNEPHCSCDDYAKYVHNIVHRYMVNEGTFKKEV